MEYRLGLSLGILLNFLFIYIKQTKVTQNLATRMMENKDEVNKWMSKGQKQEQELEQILPKNKWR